MTQLALLRAAAAICLLMMSTAQFGLPWAVAETRPSNDVIFDFDGHRIALERKYARIAHFNPKNAATKLWVVEPPYESSVTYHIDNLPKSDNASSCDRLPMGIFASKQVPLPLGEPAWMRLKSELTEHAGVVRLTETLTGQPDELGCSPAACNVTFEIEAPLYGQINYPPKLCAIENVVLIVRAIKRELQGRIVR